MEGGAAFIGQHLVDAPDKNKVVIKDEVSRWRKENINSVIEVFEGSFLGRKLSHGVDASEARDFIFFPGPQSKQQVRKK